MALTQQEIEKKINAAITTLVHEALSNGGVVAKNVSDGVVAHLDQFDSPSTYFALAKYIRSAAAYQTAWQHFHGGKIDIYLKRNAHKSESFFHWQEVIRQILLINPQATVEQVYSVLALIHQRLDNGRCYRSETNSASAEAYLYSALAEAFPNCPFLPWSFSQLNVAEPIVLSNYIKAKPWVRPVGSLPAGWTPNGV